MALQTGFGWRCRRIEAYAPVTSISGSKITVMGVELDTAATDELDAANLAVGDMVYVEAVPEGEALLLKGGYVSDETFVAGETQVMVKGLARNRATFGSATLAGVKVDYTAALATQELSAAKADVAFFGVMFSSDTVYATDLQVFE